MKGFLLCKFFKIALGFVSAQPDNFKNTPANLCSEALLEAYFYLYFVHNYAMHPIIAAYLSHCELPLFGMLAQRIPKYR